CRYLRADRTDIRCRCCGESRNLPAHRGTLCGRQGPPDRIVGCAGDTGARGPHPRHRRRPARRRDSPGGYGRREPELDDPRGSMINPAETDLAGNRHSPSIGSAVAALAAREPMIVAAVALFIAFVATSSVFGSIANIENILRQMAPVLLLGLGMMIVVLVGVIDLSVGSVVLAGSVAAG